MRSPSAPSSGSGRGSFTKPMLFPEHYGWIVFLATMDILFTAMILYLGGSELNWLAAAVIERHDLPGMVIYKFGLITMAVVTMEMVGRRKPDVGAKLARMGVLLSMAPVLVGFAHLLVYARNMSMVW